MAKRRFWSRWIRLGIDEGAPETEAKYIVVANVGVSFTILVNVPYLPVVWSSGSTFWAGLLTAFLCAMGLALWFRFRRWQWLATTFALGACFGWVAACLVIFGSGQHPHLYFLAIAMAALFVYPPAHAITMWVFVALGALAFVTSVLAGVVPPLLELGPNAAYDRVMNVAGFTLVLISVAAYERWVVDSAEAKLDEERQRSESLLVNVLPEPIAARLKRDETVIADSLSEVTVLFADVAGFTPMSSKLAPEQVVGMLNEIFTEFDHLAEKHRLEKIKTIGDAYMVAGGLPEPRGDHAEAVADMALGMIEVLRRMKTPTGDPLDLRIGIQTGPVVAGVIGKKKFSYDLWGDTVNTASRMESHGASGRIHVTAAVHEKLKGRFDFEDRGPISVKGKGQMTTWFLLGRTSSVA